MNGASKSTATLVNYDLPWNPMKIEQRIGRVHRIGQRREVHVYSSCAKAFAEGVLGAAYLAPIAAAEGPDVIGVA